MKRSALLVVMVLGMVWVTLAVAREISTLELNAGDEVFACNCGEKCGCLTMSRNAGKCGCGNEMVKAKVTRVEGGSVMLSSEGWDKERPFVNTAKFTCACGPDCRCDTISQHPGKCTCGKEMKKAM